MGKHDFLLTRTSLITLLVVTCATITSAQDDDGRQREKIAAARFQKLLERTPRRGTAFDRVYSHHIENSSVDEYVATLQKTSSTDGKAALILGMVESRRGNDAKATAAFASAERLLPDNSLPSQYLAQSQISVGQPNEAVKAFERALKRSKLPTERLELYKALGRTHQRSYHQDEALDVWKRMEEEFPSNVQVQEEIATALAEDGLNDQALKRYEQLAKLSSDNYRKVTYSIRQAELMVRLNRSDEAIKKLETISETLKPDGWLHRDVRDRIEHVFLRNDNFEGLATYLQDWVKAHPDDVDALARLGQTLASQGRNEEASETLSKAIDAAPSNIKLRELLIQSFTRASEFDKAIEQYAELHRIDPSNTDHLIRWGQAVAQAPKQDEEARKTAAAEVWKKILDKNGEDPVRIIRVAELLRGIEQSDEAIALYRKAVELSPDSTQYLEYLGEYLHRLERKDEAMAVWQQMASGKLETPDNLLRLSEVYSEFGLDQQAIDTVAKAADLESDRFDIQRAYALRLMDVKKWDEALKRLDIAETLAESEEDSDNIFKKRVEVLRSGELLAGTTDALEAELNSGTNATANRWTDLARYAYALSDMKRSVAAIRKAIALDDSSIHVAVTAAEIYESSGQPGDAASIRNRLAEIDRRFRSVHLMKVAELHMQLGQKDEAYTAGKKVLEAAGSGPEQARFFADLCFRLNREKEAIDTLRRNVRLNPNDISVQWTLAQALATRFKTAEAIEVYWQSFEKCEELDEKLRVIGMLSELYLRTNRFERFLARLERQNREAEDRRMTTMCLAQAYREIQDYASARMELEKLLAEESKDTQLLGELSKLSEAERDYPNAIKYQRRIVEVASAPPEENRLAELYVKDGDIKAAEEIWARMAVATPEFHTALKSVDGLMSKERWEAASKIVEQLETEHPGNWELLYRRAVIAHWQKDEEAATEHFKTLMNLPVDRDTKSAQAIAAARKSKRLRHSGKPIFGSVPIQSRISQTGSIRYVTGHTKIDQDYHKRRALDWKPNDFGQARMAATGWLYKKDGRGWKENGIHIAVRTATYPKDCPADALWNLYEFQRLQYSGDQSYLAAERLSKRGIINGHYALLSSISGRRNNKNEDEKKATKERNTLQLSAFWTLRRERPDWDIMQFAPVIMKELKDVGGKEEQTKFFNKLKDSLKTPVDRIQLITVAREMRSPKLILEATANAQKGFASLRQNIPEHRSQLERRISELYRSGNSQAKQKKYKLSLQFFDAVMNSLDLIQKGQRSTSNYASTLMGSRSEYYVYTYETDKSKYSRLSYPQESKFFSRKRIEALRNWYVFFTRDDKLDLLTDHLQKNSTPVDDSPAARQKATLARLARSYIHGWAEEPERSLTALTEAQQLVADDIGLLIELVMLQSGSGQLNLALANIDAFEPLNRAEMQDRELVALNLAVKTGQLDRARLAAERLFGLRLSNDIELLLAQQMNQLGMYELSQTVMDRARQKVSRNAGSLVKLMQQYNSQGQKDTAQEVALQLLQGTRRQSVQPGYYNETNSAREQALRLLSGSGMLKELTESVEKQLERSPRSEALMRTLLEYYQGSGEKEKAAKLSARLLDSRDDDPQLRFDIAQQQAQQGDHETAMDNFLIAIKQKPELLRNGYYRMQNSMRSTKRGEDLADVLMEIDLNKIGQTWAIGNTVEMLFRSPETKAAGYKLFDKAWEKVDDKVELLRSVSFQEDFWQADDAWKYAEGLLLLEEKKTSFNFIASYAGSSNGKLIGPLSRSIEVAERMGKLGEIEVAVREKLDDEKTKLVNTTLLAILEARQNRPEEATSKLEAILADDKAGLTSNAARIIGQVLEGVEGMDSIVIRLYERTIDETLANADDVYNQSVGKALFASYKKLGKKDKAHSLLMRFAKRKRQVPSYNLEYEAQRTLLEQHELGKDLLELGYPIDAIRILNKGESNKAAQKLASHWGGSNYNFKATIASAVSKLKDVPAAELLDGLLPDPDSFKPQDGVNTVELGLIVQPETLDAATVKSLVTQVLAESRSEISEDASSRIASLLTAAPKDSTLALVHAAINLRTGKAIDAFTNLQTVLAEPLPEKPLPSMLEARIAVWPLTRQAASHPELKNLVSSLAQTAISAARQHPDRKWLMAIMREQAEQFAEGKDLEQAEAAYGELIDLVITPVSAEVLTEKDGAQPKSTGGRTLTSDQFDKVIQIAETAATQGLPQFAVNRIALALKDGPPMDPISLDQIRNRSVIRSTQVVGGNSEDQRLVKVAEKLTALSASWKSKNIDASAVYDLFHSLVLPDNKDTILPYWSNLSQVASSSGLLSELIQWAERSDKTDELLNAVSARRSRKNGEVMAQVATLMIHQAAENEEAVRTILVDLTRTVQEAKKADMAQLIAKGAAASCQKKELAAESLELILACASHMQPQMVSQLDSAVQTSIRNVAETVNADQASKLLDRYLTTVDPRKADTNNNAEYSAYLRRQQLTVVIQVLLDKELLAPAMKYISEAQTVDASRYGQFNIPGGANRIRKLVAELPPDEQYELLSKWILPLDDLTRITELSGTVVSTVPQRYLKLAGKPAESQSTVPVTIFNVLLDAAEATGNLEKLAEIVAARKPRTADEPTKRQIEVQLNIRRGNFVAAADVIKQRVEAIKKETPADTVTQRTGRITNLASDGLIAKTALEVSELHDAGRELLVACNTYMKRNGYDSAFATDILKPEILAAYGDTNSVLPSPGLSHWTPAMVLSMGSTIDSSIWASDGKSVAQVAKQGYSHMDQLIFKYPLKGKFEVSIQAATDGTRGLTLAYGGVNLMSDYNGQKSVYVNSMSAANSQGTAPLTAERNKDFDSWKIVSDGKQTDYFFNNEAVFTDKSPSASSPWLQLQGTSYGGGPVAAKDVTITGSPEIPRQVSLLAGDRMDGWSSMFYYELLNDTTTNRFNDKVTIQTYNRGDEVPQPWSVTAGVLNGKTTNRTQFSKFSWLNYHRPLLDGEQIKYEFFYKKDSIVAHPAIGRSAFLLTDDGIRLHWMNAANYQGQGTGLSVLEDENEFDVPEYRKGPAKLPLLNDDWNNVIVQRIDGEISLQINGTEVYRYPLDVEDLANFGFFRDRTKEEVRVRNIVLSGDWPTELTPEILNNMFGQDENLSDAQRTAQKKLMELSAE